LSFLFIGTLQAQKHSETIKEDVQFPSQSSDNLLVVYNIEGSVEVEGYSGNTVQVVGDLEIKGNNTRQLEQGKSEISMKVASHNDIIYVYLDTPDTKFNPETGRYGHNNNNWNGNRYHYTLDIKIKVPRSTNLELSTINKGVVVAKNIDANDISASNINGPISLENVSGKTYVNALNKDINISYSKNPTEESTFKSLNGDINISVQKGFNADVSFKTLNGEIYTNIDTKIKPSKVSSTKNRSSKKGTKYKMNANTEFSIGNGGVQLNFDLLNGNVTIKE
jgi:hypothetical protein